MKATSRILFRRELPWLVAEMVLLVVITHANPSERLTWLVLAGAAGDPGLRRCMPSITMTPEGSTGLKH